MKRLFLLLVLLIGCAYTEDMQAAEKLNPSITGVHKAIAQESAWLNTARALTPEDLRGRIILLDFWTFCCINCMHVIPDLHYLEETFGDKLTVIGVHSAKFANEKESANIRNAILRYDIVHPVVNDAAFRIWQSFGVRAWPTLVLIGPQGKIVKAYSGEGHREDLKQDIQELLDEYGPIVNTQPLPLDLEKYKTPSTLLSFPGKLAYAKDAEGGPLFFVSDSNHHRILGITTDGKVVKVIGSGSVGSKNGDFKEAEFNHPQGILYSDNILYVADTENHLLRRVDLRKEKVETLAGTGKQGFEYRPGAEDATRVSLSSPWDLAFYPDNRHVAIAMAGTHQLWSYDINTGALSVLAGNGREYIDDGRYPHNSLSQPSGLSAFGGKLYFVDSETSSLRVLENEEVKTLIGSGLFDFGFKDGKSGTALMQHPIGVFADNSGVYIADSYNHAIRKFDPQTGVLTTLAGDGKPGVFDEPNAVVRVGDVLYIADTNHHGIQMLDQKTGKVTSLEITQPQSAAPTVPADFLPNLVPSNPADVVSGKPVAVSLQLPEGWKINPAAPSSLTLFKDNNAVVSFNVAQLGKGKVWLPALDEETYRLQGTLYFCQKHEGSQCLVQSHDQKLLVSPSASAEQVIITLAPRL